MPFFSSSPLYMMMTRSRFIFSSGVAVYFFSILSSLYGQNKCSDAGRKKAEKRKGDSIKSNNRMRLRWDPIFPRRRRRKDRIFCSQELVFLRSLLKTSTNSSCSRRRSYMCAGGDGGRGELPRPWRKKTKNFEKFKIRSVTWITDMKHH